MTGTEIYKRTSAYERDARTIRLHAPQWKLLLAYDGQRSLSEVALSAEVPFSEALPLTGKFLDQGWIAEQPITLEQYLKRTGARDISDLGASIPPPLVLHEPKAAVSPAPTPPALPVTASTPPPPTVAPAPLVPPSTVAQRVLEPTPRPATSTPAADATPASATKGRGPLRVGAVVNFLTSLVGNIGQGQLLVYRVFLRVPPELLQAEDIASVHLINDTSLIRGESLQQAVASAVLDVVQRTLPDSVFAPA